MDSRPLQALAPGFLNVLGVKNLGQLPDVLLGNVQPTLDMLQHYLIANRESLIGINAIGPSQAPQVFLNSVTLVPTNEVWYVHAASVGSSALVVNEQIGLQCMVLKNQVGVGMQFSSAPVSINTTGFANGGWVRTESIGGFWMTEGDQIALVLNGYVGGARNIFVDALVSKFRA